MKLVLHGPSWNGVKNAETALNNYEQSGRSQKKLEDFVRSRMNVGTSWNSLGKARKSFNRLEPPRTSWRYWNRLEHHGRSCQKMEKKTQHPAENWWNKVEQAEISSQEWKNKVQRPKTATTVWNSHLQTATSCNFGNYRSWVFLCARHFEFVTLSLEIEHSPCSLSSCLCFMLSMYSFVQRPHLQGKMFCPCGIS